MTNRTALIALRDAVVVGEIRPYEIEESAYEVWERDEIKLRRWEVASLTAKAYEGSVDAAIALLEAVLPGWGWRIASCHLSDDAFVFPDYNCPVHGARLHDTVPTLVGGVEWSQFTDVDLRPSGNPARALLIATLNAMIAETKQ